MKLKEKISIDEFDGKRYQIRLVEPNDNGKAVLTHYLQNIIFITDFQSLTQMFLKIKTIVKLKRKYFMTFFRDEKSLNKLSIDDRIKNFSIIL
jgi:hypothetical protein